MLTVLLALVASASAGMPSPQEIARKQDETMAKIFKIMETISQTNWKLIDHEKLANKHIKVNGKDVEIARIIEILERTRKVNWRVIGSLYEQKKISLNQKATVNGQQIDLIMMLKVLESVCEADWTQFESSPGKKKLSRFFFLIFKLEKQFKKNYYLFIH